MVAGVVSSVCGVWMWWVVVERRLGWGRGWFCCARLAGCWLLVVGCVVE
jgi:hypothetical protein